MSRFTSLTRNEITQLDELLNISDSILGTTSLVIKGNPKAARVIGTAIGGATGTAIATSAGTVGVASATLGMSGIAKFSIASAAMLPAALPLAIITLIGAGVGLLFGKNKTKKKEQQKQANYCKELAEKQQKIYEKYVTLMREHDSIDKAKDDIITKQQEKIAEYEAIFEALKKKRQDLEGNLAFG